MDVNRAAMIGLVGVGFGFASLFVETSIVRGSLLIVGGVVILMSSLSVGWIALQTVGRD